jgi:hypothetical protein
LSTLLFVAGCAKKPVAVVPTSFVTFQPSDSAFVCDAPSGWENSKFAQMDTDSGGNFVSGPATINITSSLTGGLLGDMANANNAQAQNLASQLGTAAPVGKAPVQAAHEQFAAAMVQAHADYAESNTVAVESKAGEGRMSEFTEDAGKTHGYRATFLGKDRSIEITCTCPQEDWTELQPAFEHVIESVAPGTGGS